MIIHKNVSTESLHIIIKKYFKWQNLFFWKGIRDCNLYLKENHALEKAANLCFVGVLKSEYRTLNSVVAF